MTPRRAPHPVRRLAILALPVAVAAALFVMLIAFLRPPAQEISYVIPLSRLEAGVPFWFQPLNMGADIRGRPYGLWLLRDDTDSVVAFVARDTHRGPSSGCAVGIREVEAYRLPVPLAPGVTATPSARAPGTAEERQATRNAYTGPLFEGLCSNSLFLLDGTRIFGPAPRGLDSLPVEIVNGQVLIDFSRIALGQCSPGIEFMSGSCPYSTPEETKYERASWPARR